MSRISAVVISEEIDRHNSDLVHKLRFAIIKFVYSLGLRHTKNLGMYNFREPRRVYFVRKNSIFIYFKIPFLNLKKRYPIPTKTCWSQTYDSKGGR